MNNEEKKVPEQGQPGQGGNGNTEEKKKKKDEKKDEKKDKGMYTKITDKGLIKANFGSRKGIIMPGIGVTTDNATITDRSIPSVVGLVTELAIPHNLDNTFEQCADQIYTTLLRVFPNATYSENDVMCYILSVCNLHAAYCTLKRAYQVMNSFDLYDASLPQAFFAAMGFDYDTFRANAAGLRSFAKQFSAFIANLAPLKLDVITRYRWMFGNIFADSNEAKASYYLFSPQHVVSYDTSVDATAGDPEMLNWADWTLTNAQTGQPYGNVITNLRTLIDNFQRSSIFDRIANHIATVYGKDMFYSSEVWDESATLKPQYSERALMMIQNCNAFGDAYQSTKYVWDSGVLKTQIVLDAIAEKVQRECAFAQLHTPYINTYKDTLSTTDLMYATSLQVVLEDNDWNTYIDATNGTDVIVTPICGTEIVLKCFAINRVEGGTFAYNFAKCEIAGVDSFVATQALGQVAHDIFCWSAMDYAPRFSIILDRTTNLPRYDVLGTMWDFNNFAPSSVLMQNSYIAFALMNLFYLPMAIRTTKIELIKK